MKKLAILQGEESSCTPRTSERRRSNDRNVLNKENNAFMKNGAEWCDLLKMSVLSSSPKIGFGFGGRIALVLLCTAWMSSS